MLYNPKLDSFETSEIWQEIARSLRGVIPQGPGSTPPGVREIYFVQDSDDDTQFLARMYETIKKWLWENYQIPRKLVYVHGRVALLGDAVGVLEFDRPPSALTIVTRLMPCSPTAAQAPIRASR